MGRMLNKAVERLEFLGQISGPCRGERGRADRL